MLSNKSNLYFTFQDYLRDLEKEEEEQKKIQKVLLCLSSISGVGLYPLSPLFYCTISSLFSNKIGRIEKDRT